MAKGPAYRIPVDGEHKASIANKDALTGALWAGVAHPFLAAAAALGGGLWGKRHLKHQQEEGKVVKPPRFLNREFLLGGMIGAEAALLPVVVAGFLGAGAIITAPLTVFAVAAIAPLVVIGSVIGAFKGKQKQTAAYEDAKAYVAANGEFDPQLQKSPVAEALAQQQSGNLDQARQQMNPDQLAQLQALAAQGQAMAPAQPETQAQKLQQHQHSQNQQAGR